MSTEPSDESGREPSPQLRILRGRPTDAELAALVVTLQSLGAAEPEPESPRSGWAAYWRNHRPHLQPGPDAWRHSLRG
ncbi:MAG: acyl-CoA carboxylase subunit epsilon [Propionibacteriaceae bacterium]